MSRIRRRRRQSGKGGNILFGIVVILVIYLTVTGIAGKWVAQHVITPVFNAFEGKSAAKEEETVSAELKLRPQTMYFIQLGLYDEQKNAEKQAVSVRLRGAAGYVRESEAQYRVLAWGYKSESAAQQVKKQLMEQENTPSEIYTASSEAVTLKVSGKAEEVALIRESVESYAAFMEGLDTLTTALEQDTMGMEGVRTELKEISAQMLRLTEQLEQMDAQKANKCVQAMKGLYTYHSEAVDELLKRELTQGELSAQIKFIYIDMYYRYADMLESWVA